MNIFFYLFCLENSNLSMNSSLITGSVAVSAFGLPPSIKLIFI